MLYQLSYFRLLSHFGKSWTRLDRVFLAVQSGNKALLASFYRLADSRVEPMRIYQTVSLGNLVDEGCCTKPCCRVRDAWLYWRGL
jgi:hypothetical protein